MSSDKQKRGSNKHYGYPWAELKSEVDLGWAFGAEKHAIKWYPASSPDNQTENHSSPNDMQQEGSRGHFSQAQHRHDIENKQAQSGKWRRKT